MDFGDFSPRLIKFSLFMNKLTHQTHIISLALAPSTMCRCIRILYVV